MLSSVIDALHLDNSLRQSFSNGMVDEPKKHQDSRPFDARCDPHRNTDLWMFGLSLVARSFQTTACVFAVALLIADRASDGDAGQTQIDLGKAVYF